MLACPPPLADKENSNRVGGGGSASGGHAALDRKISTSSTASFGGGGCGNVDKLKIIDFGLARELGTYMRTFETTGHAKDSKEYSINLRVYSGHGTDRPRGSQIVTGSKIPTLVRTMVP